MPVYVNIYNLIIDKNAITQQYAGGIEQFRIDHRISEREIHQEDDELFSLGALNADEYDIELLVSKGLNYDFEKQQSNDFTILYRYGDFLWEVDWLNHNRVFAWHINMSTSLKQSVEEISNMPVDEIVKQMEQGNNLLKTIRSKEY